MPISIAAKDSKTDVLFKWNINKNDNLKGKWRGWERKSSIIQGITGNVTTQVV